MKQGWFLAVLLATVGILTLSCGLPGSQTTDETPASGPPAETSAPAPADETSAPASADETPTSPPQEGVGLANPAAVYCQEQGYRSEIRTAADGSQAGVCILPDGSECDEWAYFRGECGPTQPLATPAGGKLWLDKTEFDPGEMIQVHFETPGTFSSSAWVGIIPSEVPHGSETVNDEYDLDYDYLEGQVSGVLSFLAPAQPGSYDFRLHDSDTDGLEAASVTFTVAGGSGQPAVWLDKTTFAPGEEIQVHFVTPGTFPVSAWIGIIPSDVPHGSAATNDENDLDYAYLDGQVSGVLIFNAPTEPGSYDFRLNDSDEASGQEVASITFQVTGN